MNIKTLEFIHQLLSAEEARLADALKKSREKKLDAMENDLLLDLVSDLTSEYEMIRYRHSLAFDALQDFESHDFR